MRDLPDAVVASLRRALTEIKVADNPSWKAWILRSALEETFAALSTTGRDILATSGIGFPLRRVLAAVSKSIKYVEASPEMLDGLIRMAWHDRTSFEQIRAKTGLRESEVICLMRRSLKRRSFTLWRARVSGRVTKHRTILEKHLRSDD